VDPCNSLSNIIFLVTFDAAACNLALLTFLTLGFFVTMITIAPANQQCHSGQREKIRTMKVLPCISLQHRFGSLAVCFVSPMEVSPTAAAGQ